MEVILTPIYEEEFLGISYGFRLGRGAHDALDALAYAIERRKVNWILDADIGGYFDSISRDWLTRSGCAPGYWKKADRSTRGGVQRKGR